MRGGNTGGCTLIIGKKFMRKQAVGMHFADGSGDGGHMQSEKWGKGKIPMFWKAKDPEKMGGRIAQKMGVETRELRKMSLSGEIKTNVKVTSISAEQRESAREAKEEKSPALKSGKKKVSFAKELPEYAPRSKVYVTQPAFDTDKGDNPPDQGERKVTKLSKETKEQAAKELGQIRLRRATSSSASSASEVSFRRRSARMLPSTWSRTRSCPSWGSFSRRIIPRPKSPGCISPETTSG